MHTLNAAELARSFRSLELSPVDVAEAMLSRIDRLDRSVAAFVHVDRSATIVMAHAAAVRHREGRPLSPLDGVPVTIKDLLAVAGWPLRRGSLAMDGRPAAVEDAAPVARLREAGAVFLGKTATPDSGSRITTRSAVHGVTRNPYDLERTPGGSSGGAAVAVALGIGPIALGTDGAGSLRIPGAWTGTFGLKPSFGRVPIHPPSLFMPHSVTGAITRTVADAVTALSVLARPDPRDPYSWPVPFDAGAAGRPAAGLRVGVTRRFGVASPAIEPEIADAVRQAARILAAAGAEVSEVEPEWPVDPLATFLPFWEATYAASLSQTLTDAEYSRVDRDLQAICERGRLIDTLAYHRAMADRMTLAAASKALFNSYDVLIGPVMPCQPPTVENDAPAGEIPGDWRWCPFTYIWNMTGQPAASIPVGADRSGMPLGVQLVGWVGGEAEVLRAAAAIENAAPRLPPPDLEA